MTKQELIEELENKKESPYYQETLSLLIQLIKGLDDDDEDIKRVLEDETALDIVDMLCDCYTGKDLIAWLEKQDWNPFNDYRFADIERLSAYQDWDDFRENSGAFYNGDPDCLIYHEKEDGEIIAVKSW